MAEQMSFATTGDGRKIAYRIVGKGETRCVLVHSLAMDHKFWRRIVPLIEEEAKILLIDCRGHGQSDKPAGPYSCELFANDIADLYEQIGWESAVVCGASMGGSISIAFAAGYPQHVDGLGLFDTTAWYGQDAPAAWEERAMKAKNEGLAALAGFQKSRWFSERFNEENPAIVEQSLHSFLSTEIDAYVETCRMLGRFDKRANLSNFNIPCEIVVGEEDYATPVSMAQALAAAITGSNLTIIEKARHLTPLEVPEIVAGAIKTLLAKVEA